MRLHTRVGKTPSESPPITESRTSNVSPVSPVSPVGPVMNAFGRDMDVTATGQPCTSPGISNGTDMNQTGVMSACQYAGCRIKKGRYNWPGRPVGEYCARHRRSGMVEVCPRSYPANEHAAETARSAHGAEPLSSVERAQLSAYQNFMTLEMVHRVIQDRANGRPFRIEQWYIDEKLASLQALASLTPKSDDSI